VLDTQAGQVVRVDIESGETEVVGRPGPGRDNLAFNAEDRLFVSSFSDSSIIEVTGPETNREVVPGGVSMLGGLTYVASSDGPGRLFVADGGALRELDPVTGAEIHAVVGFTSDLGQAHSVQPYGEHLALSGGAVVTIWDADADELVARAEGFEEAIDVVGHGDHLVVSEFKTGSVLRLDPASPADRSVIASGLQEPAGLAADGGDLYVADRSGSILQVLEDGELLEPPRSVATGLAGPEGIAVDEDGTIYVVEVEAERVSQVDPGSGAVTVVVEGLELRGLERKALEEATSVGYLNGIAVGNGSLFVSSYANNRIYRIER
jgi:sugar lactone lactonase YvrE